GFGSASAAWPVVARAQQAVPVIGYLGSTSPNVSADQLAGLRHGLNDAAFVEGRDVAIEFRWSAGVYNRLPALAAELANRQVTAILASGLPAALSAKAATTTIPIVFVSGA